MTSTSRINVRAYALRVVGLEVQTFFPKLKKLATRMRQIDSYYFAQQSGDFTHSMARGHLFHDWDLAHCGSTSAYYEAHMVINGFLQTTYPSSQSQGIERQSYCSYLGPASPQECLPLSLEPC